MVAQVTVAVLQSQGLLAGLRNGKDIPRALTTLQSAAATYPVAAALCELWKGTSSPETCLRMLCTQAQTKDPTALWVLGLCLNKGPRFASGMPTDVEESVEWLRLAADRGHAGAQFDLGRCYYDGEGVAKDVERAAMWLKKAAEQGHMKAQKYLSLCYTKGEGVEQDRGKAANWLIQAVQQERWGTAAELKTRRLGSCECSVTWSRVYINSCSASPTPRAKHISGLSASLLSTNLIGRQLSTKGRQIVKYHCGHTYLDNCGVCCLGSKGVQKMGRF